MMIFEKGYNINIYGDGKHEYNGFYMVVIDKFDKKEKWLGKKVLYIKGDKSDLLDLCHKSACNLYNLKKYSKIILEKKITLTFLAE